MYREDTAPQRKKRDDKGRWAKCREVGTKNEVELRMMTRKRKIKRKGKEGKGKEEFNMSERDVGKRRIVYRQRRERERNNRGGEL